MAERIPREESLRRVHGVGALFSAAYGNVGSSIYYALGVVAGFALGLTPLTFLIAGLIFAVHRGHLHRGDGDVPGGRRARRASPATPSTSWSASSPAGARCSTTSSRPRSRPSSCPTTCAVFWPRAAPRPGRRDRAGSSWSRCWRRSTSRGPRSRSRLNLVLAIGDLCTQILLVAIGIALVLSPSTLIDNVHLGVAPTWGNFGARDRGRDDRLHGDRDDLEHGRGGARREANRAPRHRAGRARGARRSTCCSRSSPCRRCR